MKYWCGFRTGLGFGRLINVVVTGVANAFGYRLKNIIWVSRITIELKEEWEMQGASDYIEGEFSGLDLKMEMQGITME